MKETENKENTFDLNLLAKHAYEVCRQRGKDSGDMMDFLKYLAGEVVEATEACKISTGDFALELADVIMTCLIIMHKCGINARSALTICHAKNREKSKKERGGE